DHADTSANRRPPAGEHIKRGDLPGQMNGVVHRQYGDARAEPDVRRDGSHMRQGHPWLDKTAVGTKIEPIALSNPSKGHDVVLADPQRLEAALLGHPRQFAHLRWIDRSEVEPKFQLLCSIDLQSHDRQREPRSDSLATRL